jgi:hypothetical protein
MAHRIPDIENEGNPKQLGDFPAEVEQGVQGSLGHSHFLRSHLFQRAPGFVQRSLVSNRITSVMIHSKLPAKLLESGSPLINWEFSVWGCRPTKPVSTGGR